MDEPLRASPPTHETDPEETPSVNALPTQKVTVKDIYGDLLTPTNLVLVGAALLLGLIGLLGGWDRIGAKEAQLTSVAVGKELKAAPFTMTFRKAYWYRDVPGLPYVDENTRGLLVTVDVVNTSNTPINLLDLHMNVLFRLKGIEGLVQRSQPVKPEAAKPALYRASDMLNASQVQPGLPTRLVMMWEQFSNRPLPKTLTVVAYQHEYGPDPMSGVEAYWKASPAAEVTLPLQEVPVP